MDEWCARARVANDVSVASGAEVSGDKVYCTFAEADVSECGAAVADEYDCYALAFDSSAGAH